MHCFDCGQKLDVPPVGHARCPACGWVHYNNPAPAVGIILVRDGRVLLSCRARPPHDRLWDLPGGFLEARESPQDGVARELLEETGMVLMDATLLGAWAGEYGNPDKPTLSLIYHGEASGDPVPDDDSAGLRWFALDDLPDLAWQHETKALRTFVALP